MGTRLNVVTIFSCQKQGWGLGSPIEFCLVNLNGKKLIKISLSLSKRTESHLWLTSYEWEKKFFESAG